MKIFLDSADLTEIKKYHQIIYGVTTTPTIIKTTHGNFEEFINSIRREYPHLEVHIEAMGDSDSEIVELVHSFMKQAWYDTEKIAFKIPIDLSGLIATRRLKAENKNIKINLHMAFSVAQVIMAMSVEPAYIAPLIGRYSDKVVGITNQGMRARGSDPGHELLADIIKAAQSVESKSDILVSSTRTVYDLEQAIVAGADVITMPPHVLQASLEHEYTTEGIAIFARDL